MARAGVVLWLLHPAQPGPCPALKGNPLHVRFKTRHVASATTDCPSQEKSGCPKSQHQFQKRGSRVFQRGKAGAPGALCSKTWHWGKQRLGATGRGLCFHSLPCRAVALAARSLLHGPPRCRSRTGDLSGSWARRAPGAGMALAPRQDPRVGPGCAGPGLNILKLNNQNRF